MATIVVHGTGTVLNAASVSWWWNSWQPGGFLHAVTDGMTSAGGRHDLWRLGGRGVSEWPELREKRSILKGHAPQWVEHDGHVMWSGADMPMARADGGLKLARYLNRINQLAPNEPIRVIAHSHGCNVVKHASLSKELHPGVRISAAVFLACPHVPFEDLVYKKIYYRPAPERLGAILNLYSILDSVQGKWAELVTGHFMPVTMSRIDPDEASRHLYQDHEIATLDDGVSSHSAMHGARVGWLVGRWLAAGGQFARVLKGHSKLLPVPRGDTGE